jgi:hypothetical protein
MKTIKLDKYSELVDEVLDLLELKNEVSIFCDYELASLILELIDEDDFKETSIKLDNNIEEYYVNKCFDTLFINPARSDYGEYNGKLLSNESSSIFIVEDTIEDINEVISAYGNSNSIVLLEYNEYDLDELYDDCDSCCGCEDDDEEFECDCLDCTVERYKNMILKTLGCPNCIEEILKDFVCNIVDHLFPDED